MDCKSWIQFVSGSFCFTMPDELNFDPIFLEFIIN